MPAGAPCMSCGAPLDSEGNCATKDCMFNPASDMQEYEGEVKQGEQVDEEAAREHEIDQLSEEREDLHGDLDDLDLDFGDIDEDQTPDAIAEQVEAEYERAEKEREQKKRDGQDKLSDEGQGEPSDDAEDMDDPEDFDQEKAHENMRQNQPEDDKGSLDDFDEDNEGGDDGSYEYNTGQGHPSEDPPESDDDLPPRPLGCNGDCQPSDGFNEDGDICPHCTAKKFREQMDEEQKKQDQEQMRDDWQDFLDNWAQEAEESEMGGQGEGSGQNDKEPEQQEPEIDEEISEQNQQQQSGVGGDSQGDNEDDPEHWICPSCEAVNQLSASKCVACSLPRPPAGCSGDCQPKEDAGEDDQPCPHCTAKKFRDEERQRQRKGEGIGSEDEQIERWEDFLREWMEQKESDPEPEDEPEQMMHEEPPEELAEDHEPEDEQKSESEDPPEDELNDGEAEHKDDEPEDEGEKKEDEPKEFRREAKELTVTQEKRFDNIVERVSKKVEQTFGQTAEDIHVGRKTEGQFAGEEISQSIQIESRGVTYFITVSAAKKLDA